MGKFINPFTDFGFKHIFGREMDKDILIEFLNDLLEGEHTIKDLRIMNNERLPETEQGRKVIFDIHCETDKGERIIIEMQNREQPHFKDRALYYLSHSVVEQGIKGTWDYELAAVYGVSIMIRSPLSVSQWISKMTFLPCSVLGNRSLFMILRSMIVCSPSRRSFRNSIKMSLSISLPNMCLKPKSVKGLINFPIVFIGFSD